MPQQTTPAPRQTTEITTYEQLRELIGDPKPQAVRKERAALEDLHREWLAHSPFCLVATSAPDGSCDTSPKGDPPGFTHVIDDRTIAIPDRPGNRRVDGFRNILDNPHVGLLYIVPGRGDTLRINGRARLVGDAPYFDELVVRGHRPRLAIEVSVEQVYFHCPKAFMRSKLWDSDSWDTDGVPTRPQIAKRLERPDDSMEEIERYYGPAYAEQLYRESR